MCNGRERSFMKKKFFSRLSCCCALIFIFFHCTASAEFYQYTDPDGNLIFTDDLSRIPVNQRSNIKILDSVQPVGNLSESDIDTYGSKKESGKKRADPVAMQREKLERDYLRLQQARKRMLEEKDQVKTLEQQQAYNEKVNLLNQQIDLFSQQIDTFNKSVSAYKDKPGTE
jgi:hypothetical protein